MKNSFIIISLLSILLGVESAFAHCAGLNISAQSALVNMNTQNDSPIQITVSRSSPENNTCNFMVFIKNNGSEVYTTRKLTKGGDSIPIQFYDAGGHAPANIIRSGSEATNTSHALLGAITNNTSSVNVYYYPYIDTSLVRPTGPYIDRYSFQIYSWDGSSFSSRSSVNTNASTNYKYTIENNMSLSLVDRGSLYNAADFNQTINFGSLTNGETMGFDLFLTYSDGYKLYLLSTNSGNLKNTSVASNNLIPYTLKFDNSIVALSNTEQLVRQGTGSSISGGTKILVDATVGTIGSVYSGTYSDTVTFRIAAP